MAHTNRRKLANFYYKLSMKDSLKPKQKTFFRQIGVPFIDLYSFL
jgi:hypothetical protein